MNHKCSVCRERRRWGNNQRYNNRTPKTGREVQKLIEEGDSIGLYKQLKFDHIDKCYIHKPEPIKENVTHGVSWDFLKDKNE